MVIASLDPVPVDAELYILAENDLRNELVSEDVERLKELGSYRRFGFPPRGDDEGINVLIAEERWINRTES